MARGPRPEARELVGRRIAAFRWNLFADGRGDRAHNPVITLDDGKVLRFVVEETEIGEYGVDIAIDRPDRSGVLRSR